MKRVFYIVGPTACGKSRLAAEVARLCDGEVVGADALQIYRGLPLLTAQPEAEILALAPHHLIGEMPLSAEMNAERFRQRALQVIDEIHARGRTAFVVGGSGLYVKALTHGLSPLPPANAALRAELGCLSREELLAQLQQLDPQAAASIDVQNPRRLLRALEICRLTKAPLAEARDWSANFPPAHGVFLYRERDDLYARIDERVRTIFAQGVIEEVRAAGEVSATAAQMLGLAQIRALLAGEISEAKCVAQLQQATRRYAKRQLTWFRRQSNFVALNLTGHGLAESIEFIAQKARLDLAPPND